MKHTSTLFNRRSVNNNQLQPRSPSIDIQKFNLLCFTLVKLRCIKFRIQNCFSASHSCRCHPTLPSQPTSNPTEREVIVHSTESNRSDCEQRTLPALIRSDGVMFQGKRCITINRIIIQIHLLVCFNLPWNHGYMATVKQAANTSVCPCDDAVNGGL